MPDWRWKLRLFASADLVGSTAFKAAQSTSAAPDWATTFREFFWDFPIFVKQQYQHLSNHKLKNCEHSLEAWKFLGDEILFVVELKCCQEALSHVWALREAVTKFPNREWAKKKIPLRLKAAAWLAGFPVTNTELRLSSDATANHDYIGPSIDLGFRIAKYAEPRKLMLSADLALLLLETLHDREIDRSLFRLGFSGREILRGVIGNEPYPILWLGVPDETFYLEEDLLRTPCDPGLLTDYLRRFLDATPKLMRPFIENDPHEKYRNIPNEFQNLREQMQSEENNREYGKTTIEGQPTIHGDVQNLGDPKPLDADSNSAEQHSPPSES